MSDPDYQAPPDVLAFHLEVIRRAVRFLETELVNQAPAGSFGATEARIAAEEALESLRFLECAISSRHNLSGADARHRFRLM